MFPAMRTPEHHRVLVKKIERMLYDNRLQAHMFPDNGYSVLNQSAVLFPIGPKCEDSERPDDLCLILNKRSEKVRQAGDLCCPGGGVSPRMDQVLAKLLTFPFSPLARWTFWKKCRKRFPGQAKNLAILYAACLRESFEEMRVNPLRVKFLGALHPQRLVIRDRFIYPLVGWIPRQNRFLHNWEVERIVYIPFKQLLDTSNYALFEMRMAGENQMPDTGMPLRHPGYLHTSEHGTDLLWGATFRIVMDFLQIVFRFIPPDITSLSSMTWELAENYFQSMPIQDRQ
jgi:hypothetical protein